MSKAERIKLLTGLGKYKPFSKRKLSKISGKLAKRTQKKSEKQKLQKRETNRLEMTMILKLKVVMVSY